jgi:hypothetical protein
VVDFMLHRIPAAVTGVTLTLSFGNGDEDSYLYLFCLTPAQTGLVF